MIKNKLNNSKESFESLIVEFKENRENVISILKIIIDQKKSEEFKKFLVTKKDDNQNQMKEFIKSKYYEFVESIQNINECKTMILVTDEVLNKLEENIQKFLSDFSQKYLERMKKKEDLINIKSEKEKLNKAFVFFAYLNKAEISLKDQQFELSIRLMNTAVEKFLKQFPIQSQVYKRGEELVNHLKTKITQSVEEKLTKWLMEINKEQNLIGDALYTKLKSEQERFYNIKKDFFVSGEENENRMGKNIRTTKNIVDNLLLIRNTSNLNYVMNKNSLLKTSVLNQADILEEFDIINMVSNVDLNFLEQAYSIYKKVDYDTKFIEHFQNFRQSQIQSLIRIDSETSEKSKNLIYESLNTNTNNKNDSEFNSENFNFTSVNSEKSYFGPKKTSGKNQPIIDINPASNSDVSKYDTYFSKILGFLIIQIAVYELIPVFYPKRKFEEIMNYLIRELISSLSLEFDSLKTQLEYIELEKSILVFHKSIDRIGVSEKIGVDIKSLINEMMKEKIKYLNFILIQKYHNIFVNLLFEEKCINIEVHNEDEYLKYVTQYSITLDDNSKPISLFIYPFKLPYTNYVIEVNENFNKYVEEIFAYINPLFPEKENIMSEVVGDFLKKLNEVFITFANIQEMALNIILAAQICNNLRFILKSYNYYSNQVMKICNTKTSIVFNCEKSLTETWGSYEEIIYENLKKKLRDFISDLIGENWQPEKPNTEAETYVVVMIDYLTTIYSALHSLSPYYIEFCFKAALKFISKVYFEILFNSKYVKAYNIYTIENLKLDIEQIDKYLYDISQTYPGFDESLVPMKKLISIFTTKKLDQFLDRTKKIDGFYDVPLEDVIKFLMRYKNLKKSSDMKGKITEKDMIDLVKKLKNELINK